MNMRVIVAAVLASLLVACGGGGGKKNNGGVPPPSNSAGGTFTLATNTATFNARSDQSTPLTSSIALTVLDTRDVAAVGAAYVAPNQPAPWLIVGITGSGASYSVSLEAIPIGLTPGTHTAVISIGTARANGAILQRRDITVTLNLTEITVVAELGPFGFATTFGHDDLTRPFTVHVNAPAGRSWTASSNAAWLQVPTTAFTGPADVPVVANAAGLALGGHDAQLHFASQANTADNTTRPVALTVMTPALVLSGSQLTLGGEDGSGPLTGSVLARLETGANSYPLTVTSATTTGGNWLSASGPATLGGSDVALSINALAALGTPGEYDGAVQVEANVLGQLITRTLPVRYNQDQNKLIAGTLGVAFSSLPTRNVLRRTIRISDSQGRTGIAWTATDDADWLTVTPGGTTTGELTLVANPAGLATGQMHYATVTISSTSPLVDNEQRIRVGLKVASADPVATSVAHTPVGVVANPVEPWVYLAPYGENTIEVRDVHSGAVVDTFDGVTNDPSALAISDDGRTLFVLDGWETQRVLALDAQTGAVLGEFQGLREPTRTLHYARPNDHPVLITGTTQAFDVATRTELGSVNVYTYNGDNVFAHTSDQRFIFSQIRGLSSPRVEKGRIAYSTLGTQRLVSESLFSSEYDEGGVSVCVSPDDSRVMTGSAVQDAPFNLLDVSDLQVATRLEAPRLAYGASNVACLWNGLYMGSTNRDHLGTHNLHFYDAEGNAIASSLLYAVDHEPARDRIIVSGDASRVIAVTGGPSFHTTFYDAPLVP